MQINRMFEIIYLLLDKKTITAKELAERFEVSTRTIYRDVETLSTAGIPIYMSKGKGGGISILDHFVLNKAVLTKEEKNDILSSLHTIHALKFTENNSTIQKLGSLLGDNKSDWIEVDFSQWNTSNGEAQTFQDLKSSILSQTMISFEYASGKGESTSREVEPYKICFKGMSRYLYGFCRLRQDFRFFKLSRIKKLTLTNEPFTHRTFHLNFKSNTQKNSELITLKLKFSPQTAYRVYDEFENYLIDSEGYFIVEMIYPKGEWLFPYIFSFGHHCEILEPMEIRNQIMEETKKMFYNYL